MYSNFAWIGTGECDPNKKLYEMLIAAGVILSWFIIFVLMKKLGNTHKSKTLKIIVITLIVILGIAGTIATVGLTWIGLACSKYVQ